MSATPLVSFKAGRAYRRDDSSKWVDSVEGRGLIYLQEEDGLLHFYYKDLATSSTTEPTGLDLLIFPGDATFSLLPNKRVHVLKFNSSSHVHFFWAQDVDQTRDEEVAKKVNGLIGGEEEAGEEYTGMEVEGESSALAAPTESVDLHARFRDLVAATTYPPSAAGPAPAATTTMPTTTSTSTEELFRNLMAGLPGGSRSPPTPDHPAYSLLSLFPPSLLSSLAPSSLTSLASFLPPSSVSPQEALEITLQHPEFKRAVNSFERALRSGGLGALMRGLGLEDRDSLGVEEFVEGVRRQAGRE